ncbi:MAG TPA: hypothetical protein VK145_01680 [Candidatus Nanoarchaeia archaeon]|nr:hypothetical protein [Candidatus Nanoarchaeia archaeon]
MDNRLQATFMPRQSPGANDAYVRPKGPPNFLMGIALVLILLVGAAWGGLYFYRSSITQSNEAKRAQIEAAVKNFEPELTKELTILKARVDAGKTLMSNHIAFSEFLELLGATTVQTVQFTDFGFATGDSGKIEVNLKGQARSYNAIAFQSDVFSRVKQFIAPVFSGLVLDEKGNLNFSVSFELDPSTVKYSDLFAAAPLSLPVEVATTTTATTTPSGTTSPARTGTSTNPSRSTNNPRP